MSSKQKWKRRAFDAALDARDIALSEARELRSRLEEALGEARTARANEAEANKRLAEANSRAADLAKQLEEKT